MTRVPVRRVDGLLAANSSSDQCERAEAYLSLSEHSTSSQPPPLCCPSHDWEAVEQNQPECMLRRRRRDQTPSYGQIILRPLLPVHPFVTEGILLPVTTSK